MKKLIECVPNFSEGNDMHIIDQITDAMKTVEGISVIDVDPGKATNRTVVTMVGVTRTDSVKQLSGQFKKAAELIDMTKHKGAHPRFGATDVCPFGAGFQYHDGRNRGIRPEISRAYRQRAEYPGILLRKCCFCSGTEKFSYSAGPENMKLWENVFPVNNGIRDLVLRELNSWTAKTGATAVGARNFLVAYNVNLNTTSTRRANSIAFDVRERGRVKREGNPITGKKVLDEKGKPVMIPGSSEICKSDRLVYRRIWNSSDLYEPDGYFRDFHA